MNDDKLLKNFKPRDYQTALLQYVISNNGIIYLPTGAGKTFIAIMALKRFCSQMDKTIENRGKRGIFMCKTVELARQQCQELQNHTCLRVGLYIGERVDNWNSDRWKQEIDENQILVGTAQVFVDIVSRNFIKITDLSVVIIDECHHGTKSDPMHEFMRFFQSVESPQLLPRVIGLTGVLFKGNKVDKIMESLRNLEITYHSRIVTVSSRHELLNVSIHATNPQEQSLQYKTNQTKSDINEIIQSQVKCCLNILNEFDIGNHPIQLSKGLAEERGPNKKRRIVKLLTEFCYHMEENGLYCASHVLQFLIVQVEIKQRQAETMSLRHMYRVLITYLESMRHLIHGAFKKCLNDTNDSLSGEGYHKLGVILEFSTPKVIELLRHIESTFKGKSRKDVSCLIFVERRITARAICQVVKRFVDVTQSLKETIFPEFMVGRNSMFGSVVENMLERASGEKVMSGFRNGTFNTVICSNVLEEGIDVQACNHVIVFDPLKTFNAYIQTKGRARSKDSIYVIMAAEQDAAKAAQKVQRYKEIHESVQNFLIERIIDCPRPDQDEIDAEFCDIIPSLRTSSGSILLASSALSMLARYCQMLPWDIFGGQMAQFKKVHEKENVIVSVTLPLQSRVKEEIFSNSMKTVKLAKISAAMNACQRLYDEGELNESLSPTTKTDCEKLVADVLFKNWQKHHNNFTSLSYGKSKFRLYENKCPEELYDAMPIVGEPCYAHKIMIVPEFNPNEYNVHVIDALKTNSKYALLLRKPLPLLAEMPLFMRQGTLKVFFDDRLNLTIDDEEQLAQLRKYHNMIMRDILQCWRSYYVYDSRNKQNSFLIVPMCDNKIDWSMVQRFAVGLKPLKKPTLADRQKMSGNYKPQDWVGKVVNKWYTPNVKEHFIVTKIHSDKTPLCMFSKEPPETTYLEHFETRYAKVIGNIIDRTQFLIEVKALTSRRNFLNNAKHKNKEIKRETQTILLLPELCHNFEYPGDLYLQAVFLPSILYRLNFLLHAEFLRKRINSFLGIDSSEYKPKSLRIDASLRRAVGVDANPTAKNEVIEDVHMQEVSTENSSSKDVIWKPHEEPLNLLRESTKIYPVELQYYCNFEQRWKFKQSLDNAQFISNNQMHMSKILDKTIIQPSLETSNASNSFSNGRIEILDQSIPSSTSSHSSHHSPSINSAEQYEFLAALTTSSANDVFDMERFELLGDSFLKFSISLYLANKFPMWHEGFLTQVKSKVVSNRNLLFCMLETDIPTRICSKSFFLKEWLPPLIGIPSNILNILENDSSLQSLISLEDFEEMELDETETINGHCNNENVEKLMKSIENNERSLIQNINFCIYKELRQHKIIADTLEALFGVCVKNYGIPMSFRMLEFFGLLQPDPGDKPLTNLLDLKFGGSRLRTELTTQEVDAFLINHEDLETNLGYIFHDRAFLLQALTHPSFPTNRITGCYQELEFIGDAILDMLITCFIFERNQTMTPGMLTDLRAALVNNITLGCICVRNRFHQFLLAQNVLLAEMIRKFVEFQETHDHRVTDQVRILMEEKDAAAMAQDDDSIMNIAQNVDVPKVLGDIVEALIAAVYFDSRCLHKTWNVIYGLFKVELVEFSKKIPIEPVRQLQEHPTAKPVFYAPMTENGTTTVKCIFRCMEQSITVHGFGSNKIQAKKAAAKHALKKLGNNNSPP